MTFPVSLRFDDLRHLAAHRFLVDEAAVMDAQLWERWLEMLHPDIRYVMPVRVTTSIGTGYDVRADMAHFDEDLYSLRKRVERLRTEHAWTEDPPSRTRHVVTNVRTSAADDGNADGDDAPGGDATDLLVESSVMLVRSRGDTRAPEMVTAGRVDRLRHDGDDLLLVSRLITVDESVLRTQNLAIFL